MGTCMSKNNQTQSKNAATEQTTAAPLPQERRRRLSVSTAAEVTTNDDRDRGMVKITPGSVLNLFPNRRRFSISGVPAHHLQSSFADKTEKIEGDTRLNAADMGIGYACKKGLKPESPNQDDFFILEVDDWGLYGVFDGHGPFGHDISNYVQQNLPRLIAQHPLFTRDPKTALHEAFVEVHRLIATPPQPFDPIMSGTTGTVLLHLKKTNKLYAAHVGDSRAVLAKRQQASAANGGSLVFSSVDLTKDHKPQDPLEMQRIHSMGGEVKKVPYDIPYRVFVQGRKIPGLAMSRAIGDTLGHQVGVSCVPDVTETTLKEGEDEFVVMCSDGVWEFIESHEAVAKVARDALAGSPNPTSMNASWNLDRAASALAAESYQNWLREEETVVDDITVLIIRLFHKNPNATNANAGGGGRASISSSCGADVDEEQRASLPTSSPSRQVGSMTAATHSPGRAPHPQPSYPQPAAVGAKPGQSGAQSGSPQRFLVGSNPSNVDMLPASLSEDEGDF